MIKKYLLLLLVLSSGIAGVAQVSLQPVVPAAGMIQKNHLWNVMVINSTGAEYNCRLELVLRDRQNGLDVMTAATGMFTLAKGARQLNVNALMPIQYNNLLAGMDNNIQGLLAAGNYIACYSLFTIADKEVKLAEECVAFDVEPLSPPMLISPSDSSLLEVVPQQFSWLKPTPDGMFNNLVYDVQIVEVKEGQRPAEAIQENLPVHAASGLMQPLLNYAGAYNKLEKDKWYAWQVVARDNNNYAGKSETWVFKVRPQTVLQQILQSTPYMQLKKNNVDKTIAPNGILKISYVNDFTDTSCVIAIKDLSEEAMQDGKKQSAVVALSRGLNQVQVDLNKFMKLFPGHVYMASLVNSKKETWFVMFEVKNYKN